MTLERDLRALAAGFPDPPALVPGVSAGIARASRRPQAPRRRARPGAVLVVPATVLAVSPTSVTAFVTRAAQAEVEVVDSYRPCPRPLPASAACNSAR